MTKREAMFAAAGAAAGIVVGGVSALIAAKAKYTKKLNEEVAAIKATYEKLNAAKEQSEPEAADDSKKQEDEEEKEPAEEDSDDTEDEGGIGSDYDILSSDEDDYDRLIEPYKGDLTIYNISEYEYEDTRNGYDKQEVVFFDEEEPHMIYLDSGEEVPDWHAILGYDEGCLCEEMFDSLQECYVRNENWSIDFRVHRSSLEFID